MKIKGVFTSLWDGDIEINTKASFNSETGKIKLKPVDVKGLNMLESEIFTTEDDEQYNVCPCCHRYIMRAKTVDTDGKNLEAVEFCMDPHCDNHS